MWDRIDYTFSVMGHSWGLLQRQRSLIVFPLLSAISCLLVILTFLVPLGFAGKVDYLLSEHERVKAGVSPVLAYGVTFVFYVVNYFVIVFFNAALVACAAKHMAGEETSFSDGLKMAAARLPQIFGWAVLSASVGVLFRVIENTHEKAGDIVASILGTAWTLMTYLVVPALVVEGYGPLDAVSASTRMLKKTWGDQLVSGVAFGLLAFGLMAPAIIALIWASATGHGSTLLIAGCVSWLVVVACAQSALETIFQTSLYLYSRDGQAPAGFPSAMLGRACAKA
jgi:hypothetical protein